MENGMKLSGAKVPGSESSTYGTFAPRSESTWERMFHNSVIPEPIHLTAYSRSPRNNAYSLGHVKQPHDCFVCQQNYQCSESYEEILILNNIFQRNRM